MIFPAVISSYNAFLESFEYTGTRDYTAFCALNDALTFRASLGDADIMQYIHDIAWQAAQKVAAIWGTGLLVPDEDMNGALVSVILPTTNLGLAYQAQAQLVAQYNTYVQLGITTQNVCYMRLSGQIYLELSDFTTMATRYAQLLNVSTTDQQ